MLKKTRPANEPETDVITNAILQMFNTLVLLDGDPETPFPENVKKAVEDFDKPVLRTSFSRRLYHPELYVSPSLEHNTQPKTLRFRDLQVGDLFIMHPENFGSKEQGGAITIYLKIEPKKTKIEGIEHNVFSLENGVENIMSDSITVMPVQCNWLRKLARGEIAKKSLRTDIRL